MGLTFQDDRCIGCRLCQLACSVYKEEVFNPVKARLNIHSYYSPDGLKVSASFCDMCLKCVDACPAGAINLRDGYLNVNREDCTGCGICAEACPRQVIRLDESLVPRLCDLCQGSPECVTWCPHQALALEVESK
ncbi:hypothetical protein SY88_16000 [Clostridiales bacterium PH28_bin88]|nr:hypothetical protein SY88_16000 [Clostridiales bacterium PH28_bin88]